MVRLGVIGLGRIFRVGYDLWLKEYLTTVPWVELSAMADPEENTLKLVSERYGAKAFRSGEELLADSGVDTVIINSPPWTHMPLIREAAKKGIHVLCEKPLAPSGPEAFSAVERARSAGTILSVGFTRRFISGFRYVKHVVRSGQLGRILEARIIWPYFIPDMDSDPFASVLGFSKKFFKYDVSKRFGGWRLTDPRAGGDFLDHGTHALDLLRQWFGEPDKILGRSQVTVDGHNEDDTTAVVSFPDGAFALISASLRDHGAWLMADIRGHIRGTKGSIEFVLPKVDVFKQMKSLRHYRMPEGKLGRVAFALGLKRSKVRLLKYHEFRDQLDSFVREVSGLKPLKDAYGEPLEAATGLDGAIATALVERVYKSALEGNSWQPASGDALREPLPTPKALLASERH